MSRHAGEDGGLVGDDADGVSRPAARSRRRGSSRRPRAPRATSPSSTTRFDHAVHVVRLRRIRPARSRRARRRMRSAGRRSDEGRVLRVVERHVGEQVAAGAPCCALAVGRREVGHAGARACTAAPPSSSDWSTSSCVTVFAPRRARDVHVRGAVDHADEVGDRRAVDRAAGARAEDGRRSAGRRPRRACCARRSRRSHRGS